MIEIVPVTGIGEVEPGVDLAALLIEAMVRSGPSPRPGDVIVVTQKIVSKAEDRFVDLASLVPSGRALELAIVTGKDPRLVEAILAESTAVIRAADRILITRHRLGHVMANAGIDQSNLGRAGKDLALLLPVNPDSSADRLRAALETRFGAPLAVVVSDSFGRPWRLGVVNVAIGASGIPALVDLRGRPDREGRPLEVTQVGLGDMLAAAAGLALGEDDAGLPVAIVRGVAWQAPTSPAAALVRPLNEDLFQ